MDTLWNFLVRGGDGEDRLLVALSCKVLPFFGIGLMVVKFLAIVYSTVE